MTSDYPNRRRALAAERARQAVRAIKPCVWNMRERWRTARIAVRLVLAYSPTSLGTALVVAGYLIKAIDATWEKQDVPNAEKDTV